MVVRGRFKTKYRWYANPVLPDTDTSSLSFQLKFEIRQYILQFKVAEHSFRARFRWCNSARAQGFQKTNMPSTERSFYLLNTRTHCVIFLHNWPQCIEGSSL